jgi:hypothetical protein
MIGFLIVNRFYEPIQIAFSANGLAHHSWKSNPYTV